MMKNTARLVIALAISACDRGASEPPPNIRPTAAPSGSDTAAPELASAAPSSRGSADGVVFGKPSFKPGDKITTKERLQAGAWVATCHFEAEILAVQDGKPTKSRVKFIEQRTWDKPSSVEGKTYIIEWKDGKVTRTHADGSPVPQADVGEFCSADDTQVELPSRPLEPGDEVKSADVDTMTFERREGNLGILTYSMAAEKGEPQAACTLRVRIADGRSTSIECSATVDGGIASEMTIERTYH